MSPGAARAGAYGPGEAQMTIGEVMAVLSQSFPDVSISKIRFLEDQGLVEPTRTRAGYRKFSADDVERLRYVLAAQRDHYLPLKVIREHLDALDRGLQPPPLPGAEPPRAPEVEPAPGLPDTSRFDGRTAGLRLTRTELLRESGVGSELLEALEGFGVIAPVPGGPWYDGEALEVLRAAAELAGHGIEARHLRMFRTAAEREVGLAEQIVAPLQRGRTAASSARVEETAREISAACLRLHTALVASGLARLTG